MLSGVLPVISYLFEIFFLKIDSPSVYACAVDADMSVRVVISEWLHHCVVHLKLPALSSKL